MCCSALSTFSFALSNMSHRVSLRYRSMASNTARRSLRLRVSPPIGQALPMNLLKNRCGTLLIIYAKGLTVVVAEIELIHVSLQVLFAHALVNARQAALEDREVAFNRVRMHGATDVFASTMRNGLMTGRDGSKDAVLPRFVRHQVRVGCHVRLENRLERLGGHVRDVERTHLPAALHKGEHRVLVRVAAI